MKRKEKLAILNVVQSDIKCSLISVQHRQLALLEALERQMAESIDEIEVAKQKLMEKA